MEEHENVAEGMNETESEVSPIMARMSLIVVMLEALRRTVVSATNAGQAIIDMLRMADDNGDGERTWNVALFDKPMTSLKSAIQALESAAQFVVGRAPSQIIDSKAPNTKKPLEIQQQLKLAHRTYNTLQRFRNAWEESLVTCIHCGAQGVSSYQPCSMNHTPQLMNWGSSTMYDGKTKTVKRIGGDWRGPTNIKVNLDYGEPEYHRANHEGEKFIPQTTE